MNFALDGITLAQAQANLDAWVSCSAAVAKRQSKTITIDGVERTFTYANAEHIDKMIDYWRGKVRDITAAETAAAAGNGRRGRGIRVTRGLPGW